MYKFKLTVVVLPLLFFSCGKERNAEHYNLQFSKLRNSYINTRTEVFARTKQDVLNLTGAISTFYYTTNQLNFDACKGRYMDSRYSLQLAMLFNYSNGSLAIPNQAVLNRFENFPINPGYIDYYSDGSVGIINDPVNYPTISEYNIRNWNLVNGTSNYSCGTHVLEFLLFGEDTSIALSGNRSVADFNNTRRKQYLLYTSNILNTDFQGMLDQSSFAYAMKTQQPKESFEFIIDGLLYVLKTDFAENTLKRSLIALNDAYELDRFSDYTMLELRQKVDALRVFINPRSLFDKTGEYFLADFIKEVDPNFYSYLMATLDRLDAHFNAINVSFEEALNDAAAYQELNQAYADLMDLHAKLSGFKTNVLKDF